MAKMNWMLRLNIVGALLVVGLAPAQVSENGLQYMVSPAAAVSMQGGSQASENQAGLPLRVQRLDNADGYRAVLLRYDLRTLKQTASVNSVIWCKGTAAGNGTEPSLAVYAVDNHWNPETVALNTAPQKRERLTEVTIKSNTSSGTIIFPVTSYLQNHLVDDEVSFLIEMRSAPGFSQPVEFVEPPSLRIVKAQTAQYDLQKLLRPIWAGGQIENETLLPISQGNGLTEANLAFIPSEIISVQNYALTKTYEAGKDYLLEGRTLRLTENSSIPFFKYSELYHTDPKAKPSQGH